MKRLWLILFAAVAAACARTTEAPANADLARWQQRAQAVTITRDDWGIAHVRGRTDADAVFGMIYAQAEDDFPRIERNFLISLGRYAEAEGEGEVYRDLRQKLFIDEADLKALYAKAPDWLRALMDAWADGLNYYLATHPGVTPRVLTRFEPWMALSFTEGSIGGDIERVNLQQLEAFYGDKGRVMAQSGVGRLESGVGRPELGAGSQQVGVADVEPGGSNGFAVAPSNSASKKALLWINPHTSHYFRAELQMTSDEGLNAYGAVTWGQFFIYQGFNERTGWMHTSSSVDNIDEYLETVIKKDDGVYYQYGTEARKMQSKQVAVRYKTSTGMVTKTFTIYRTHHGPIVRELDGKWVSIRLMEEPLKALTQSYTRTKTTGLESFRKVLDLHTNSSNNTVYADADGNIAYFHANFIPKRDPKLDWRRPVDGSDPATEWGPPLGVDESPNTINPPNGWVQNTNNWPYSAAGPHSPKQKDYPAYVDSGSENPRGVHAIRVLDGKKDFTIDSLIAAAFDSYLPELAVQIPLVVKAYDELPASNPLKRKLADQIRVLRGWDYRWSATSVPTSLAVFWGEDVWQRVTADARKADLSNYEYLRTRATSQQRLNSLAAASDKLVADFGRWDVPWGEINRFQRLTADITPRFDDNVPSIPVMFTSARWGSLASYGARAYPNTKKWYGTSGNSFLAAVEFGERVRAKAISAGGQSGDPASPHFRDQAERFAKGQLRDVYFYPDELKGHVEREYRPGMR